MKHVYLFALFIAILSSRSQTYSAHNINLIGHIAPVNDTFPGNKYSGCWGWYQQSKNREYAISGGSNGTYFIDVTNPASPVVCDFIPSKSLCTWREMKTYQNYCYVVSDVCTPNSFQIIDMQYLPDSVHLVHNSGYPFDRAHTIWIDKDKMYVGLVRFPGGFSAMSIFSLATPTSPVLLRRIEQDSMNIGEVHDMYVRNDTVYASAGWQGLRVMKYTSSNTFQPLGSYTGYLSHGYNHSSFLTADGKHLLFCDEVPNELPMHFVNVENLANIQPKISWRPHAKTTSHNPYILGNNFAVVSCYQDGLYIYNISDPDTVKLSGFFDTYPQGGVHSGTYSAGAYRGNWGAYPFLPSGIIIANDMQNGVFILDPAPAFNYTVSNPVGISLNDSKGTIQAYPNPSDKFIRLKYKSDGNCDLRLTNQLGSVIFEKRFSGMLDEQLDVTSLSTGCYILTIKENKSVSHNKLIIQHP
jgi:choice-of-anchor B domain-containing protein